MEENIDFVAFLTQKKIGSEEFKKVEPIVFAEWEELFKEVNPESFVMQKKFLINKIRRRFPLEKVLEK